MVHLYGGCMRSDSGEQGKDHLNSFHFLHHPLLQSSSDMRTDEEIRHFRGSDDYSGMSRTSGFQDCVSQTLGRVESGMIDVSIAETQSLATC